MFVQKIPTILYLEPIDFAHKLQVCHRFAHPVGHVSRVELGIIDGLIESGERCARRRSNHPLRPELTQQAQSPLPVVPAREVPTLTVWPA